MTARGLAILVLASVAALSAGAPTASAEDVSVNLDALGPAEPPKKPAAVKPAPKPPAAPAKPAAAPPAPSGEIDFIGRSKAKLKPEPTDAPAPKPVARPIAAPAAAKPVMSDIVPDDPPSAPATPTFKPALPATAVAPPVAPRPAVAPVSPKPKAAKPATVVVEPDALDGVANTPVSAPKGKPLTEVQPNGALFIPKSVESLPQPVETNRPASSDTEETNPLTAPPSIPEPAATPGPSSDATPAIPAKPAAAATPAASGGSASGARASVLAGYERALQLPFAVGEETLGAEVQAQLDQIAGSISATSTRIQLAAYTGPAGNTSGDNRRLSLRRALAVRDYLEAKGVQRSMVILLAFGAPPSGDTDRVDVMVRAEQLSRIATPAQ